MHVVFDRVAQVIQHLVGNEQRPPVLAQAKATNIVGRELAGMQPFLVDRIDDRQTTAERICCDQSLVILHKQ